MGRTVSPEALREGKEEFAYQTNNLILEMLNNKHQAKDGVSHISVKESLISKTASKARILDYEKSFAPEFAKCSGKKADTARIFDKVIGRTKTNETVISA